MIKRNSVAASFMRAVFFIFPIIVVVWCTSSNAALSAAPISNQKQNPHFQVLPLGTSGGEMEDNLSAYLVAPVHSNNWIALDGGTLCSAIKKIPDQELKKLNIKPENNETISQTLFSRDLKAYLISHAHLDHISGLTICSTIDSKKEIMATNPTIDYLRDDIFNWQIWPNFANEGKEPLLKKYHYFRLTEGEKIAIPNTEMQVVAFPLSHGHHYLSTAFLLEANGYNLLYFGDTGPDAVEHSQNINKIWQVVAPLIRANKLSLMMLECSYPNAQPDNLLFGHLTPNWMLKELQALATIVNPKQPKLALKGLRVMVTHIKQGLGNEQVKEKIIAQLNEKNDLGVEFILPTQHKLMVF